MGPLPGMAGPRPGAMPLPGMGLPGRGAPGMGAPSGAAPLPGMGGPRPGVVPPFTQPAAPEPPPEPGPDRSRDPFATRKVDPSVASIPVAPVEEATRRDSVYPAYSAARLKKLEPKQLAMYVGVAVLLLVVGGIAGRIVTGRRSQNIAVRDAMIVVYEVKKAAKALADLQPMLASAVQKAASKEYDPQHLAYMNENVRGNPLRPVIFSERNFKSYDNTIVEGVTDYFTSWGRLYRMVLEHRNKTENDALSLADKALRDKARYGAIFGRNEADNNKLVAKIMLVGGMKSGKDGMSYTMQSGAGMYGDSYKLFNPPEGKADPEFSKAPGDYVIELGADDSKGILASASRTQFQEYEARLVAMNDLVKEMTDLQNGVIGKLDAIASRGGAAFLAGGIRVDREFEDYVAMDKAAAAGGGKAAPAGKAE
ncbi:MAG: hypothetical protein PHU25_09765 [Deltaproteobacteria bacterium]|nr:hypothetical protein [Deltaproteobacteria bacterium]